ncbi:MAG: PhnD/SsuA/transferrin family substrate-binding protein [Myxococcota bacterium]
MWQRAEDDNASLRLVTWLAPSIPLAFYERIGRVLAKALKRPVEVASRTNRSGPTPEDDPFARGEADVGFICAPSYLSLRAQPSRSIVGLGVAPLFDDSRNAGQPVYYATVVVRRDHPAKSISDLHGGCFGYNDPVSLSGWWGMASALASLGTSPSRFFGRVRLTGSHAGSIEALVRKTVDAITIDSTLLTLAAVGASPRLPADVRVLTSIGPFPIQPIVVRAGVARTTRAIIRDALRAQGPWPSMGLVGFVPQPDAVIAHLSLGDLEPAPPEHVASAREALDDWLV